MVDLVEIDWKKTSVPLLKTPKMLDPWFAEAILTVIHGGYLIISISFLKSLSPPKAFIFRTLKGW
jgi:hypothetical protein